MSGGIDEPTVEEVPDPARSLSTQPDVSCVVQVGPVQPLMHRQLHVFEADRVTDPPWAQVVLLRHEARALVVEFDDCCDGIIRTTGTMIATATMMTTRTMTRMKSQSGMPQHLRRRGLVSPPGVDGNEDIA